MADLAGLAVQCPVCPRRVRLHVTSIPERCSEATWMVVHLDTTPIRDHLHEHAVLAQAQRLRSLESGPVPA